MIQLNKESENTFGLVLSNENSSYTFKFYKANFEAEVVLSDISVTPERFNKFQITLSSTLTGSGIVNLVDGDYTYEVLDITTEESLYKGIAVVGDTVEIATVTETINNKYKEIYE